MAFFGNKRKDFSIQPPRQQVDGTPFFVTDSANIDFTLENLNLTANLTQLLPTNGTYGSPTLIPILDIDEFGRVTGVSTTTFSASGIALEVNGTPNLSQTILNLVDSATIEVVDLGGGDIEFNYIGSGGTYTVNNGLEPESGNPNNFQLGGALTKNTTISTVSNYQLTISAPNTQNSSQPFGVTTQGDAGAASFSNSGAGKTVTIAKSNSDTAAGILYLNKSGGAANAEELFILMKKNGANTANASIKIDTYIDDSLGSQTISSSIITRAIDTVAATYTTNLEFWLSYNNNFSNAFTFKGTGQLQLNKYTAPFSGTAVYALGVDASGNVITTTGGGSGTVTSVNSGTNINVDNTNPAAPIINSLADRYKTSSVTSNSVSNGSKSFAVDINLSYIPLQEILVVHNPANHMHGELTSYNAATGALVVDIKNHTGSGTYTSWVLNLDGTPVDAITGSGTVNEIAYFTAARVIASLPVATYPSLTELSYVKNVTSAIQTQINNKLSTTLANTNIFVGNASNLATAVAMSGDTTITNAGVVALATPLKTGSFGITVDGVTTIVQVGQLGYVTIPYGGTIEGWTITANAVGNIQFDIWKANGAIPTTSIITTGFPALTGTAFATSASVGGWVTTFAAGDVFGFHIIGTPTVIKNATLTIRCTKLPS